MREADRMQAEAEALLLGGGVAAERTHAQRGRKKPEWDAHTVSVCTGVRASAVRRNRFRTSGLALIQPLGLVGVGFDLLEAVEDSAVEQLLPLRDGLEEQTVTGNLRDHEMVLGDADLVEVAFVNAI